MHTNLEFGHTTACYGIVVHRNEGCFALEPVAYTFHMVSCDQHPADSFTVLGFRRARVPYVPYAQRLSLLSVCSPSSVRPGRDERGIGHY